MSKQQLNHMPEKILIVEDELIVAKDLESMLEAAGYEVVGIARAAEEALDIIGRTGVQLVLLDIYLEGVLTGIDLAVKLNERNIAFVYLSANSNQRTIEAAGATRPYGFLVKPFREKDVLVALEIAWSRHQNSTEVLVRQELRVLDQLAQIRPEEGTYEQQLLAVTTILQSCLPFDFIELGRTDAAATQRLWRSFLRIGFNEYQSIGEQELMRMTGLQAAHIEDAWAQEEREMLANLYVGSDFSAMIKRNPARKIYAGLFDLKSQLVLPLFMEQGKPFYICFYSRSKDAFDKRMLQFMSRIQHSLTLVLGALVQKVVSAGTAVEGTKKEQTATGPNVFPGIIGKSKSLLSALDFVRQVSVVDSSVLILGETGTGKEKIAEQIHQLSARKDGPLVKVNCAALPLTLIESELFGHEKGAFTGAVSKRIGRFEQASGGTIFLDEIGDVPSDVQVKLLRVLQEREVERVGGKGTVKVDVRIIAATNKSLENEIVEGRFRMDLYYRLNVFPIWMPPLRNRIEDIPLLVDHFIQIYNDRYQTDIRKISADALEQLMRYDWPGNIRELENCIERSLVLAQGTTIEHVYIKAPHAGHVSAGSGGVKTIDEVEREHILVVLNKCNNKIYGVGGAAEMLHIPPTTLASKMKKLGIIKG
jgi:DNA-binding NtrC family response regulator